MKQKLITVNMNLNTPVSSADVQHSITEYPEIQQLINDGYKIEQMDVEYTKSYDGRVTGVHITVLAMNNSL